METEDQKEGERQKRNDYLELFRNMNWNVKLALIFTGFSAIKGLKKRKKEKGKKEKKEKKEKGKERKEKRKKEKEKGFNI